MSEPADLVDVPYRRFVRPLGNMVVLFALAEAALSALVAELIGGTERDAQQFLSRKNAVILKVQQDIVRCAEAFGIEGFQLQELSQGLEDYYQDREHRNRLIHDEWFASSFDGIEAMTRGLPLKKGAVVVWGDASPEDVWDLAERFRRHEELFSHVAYVLRKRRGDDEERATMMTDDSKLDEARRRVETIRAQLPTSIGAAELGVQSKAPYHLLLTREALAWRTEELARCACDMLERDDLAAGILLTRAVVECTALVWRLKELLEERNKYTTADLQDKFETIVLGWKNDPEFPAAFNIKTIIGHMSKRLSGVQEWYDELSEFAHPNMNGVFGLFAAIDRTTYVTKFGRGLKRTPSAAKENAILALCAFLDLFGHAYNSIADHLPIYLSELEPL